MVSETGNGLQVSVEEVAAWSRRLVITIPADRVRSERARVAKQLAKRVRVPGFRKGKIPPQRLEARFGQEIDRETRQQLVQDGFREAVRETGLEPISQPRVANVNYDPESDLTFEVAFDIWPEISLSRTGGFRVKRPAVQVNDQEVQQQLEQIRRQNALWQRVERTPRPGDSVSVKITVLDGRGEGEAETEEPEARSHRFVLGEGHAIPDVEDAIMTLEPGRSEVFTVRFPEDASDESLRGESQRLEIELEEVREPELPELDDEFARSIGDFESLDDLRRTIREERRRQKAEEADFHVRHQIIDQIIEANPFDVPDSWVEEETQRYVQSMAGDSEQLDAEEAGALRREARKSAVRGIKRTLILRKIAQEQELGATEEEVNERIQKIARRVERPVPEVRSQLARSGEIDRLKDRIIENKVLEYLKEKSEVETVDSVDRPVEDREEILPGEE